MKTYIKSAFVAIIAMVLFASNSFAASDYLLELEGVKGESKGKTLQLNENSDGTFTIENIPAGTYQLVYKAKQGKTGSAKRTGAGGGPHVLAFEYEVKAPRDVATGQSSGKRQHGAVTIRKELDKSTPTKAIIGDIIVGDLDGDGTAAQGDPVNGVDVKLGATAKGQKTAGYDLKVAKKV